MLTGETGAGKSLSSMPSVSRSARAPTRASCDMVPRPRAVEALFDRLPEPLICVREVTARGRSTARIDDETVTAARLAEPPARSSRSTASTTSRASSTSAGSATSSTRSAATRHARRWPTAVGRWRANREELPELALDPREVSRRLELLEHEAAEIAAARLRPGEAEELRGRLAAARKERPSPAAPRSASRCGGEGRGARDGAARPSGRPVRWLGSTPGSRPSSGSWGSTRTSTTSRRRFAACRAVDTDAAAVAALEERLSVIYALERRYGDDEAAVIAHGERAAVEAERLRGLESERAAREADDAELLAGWRGGRPVRLGEGRGAPLGRRRRVLQALGFPPAAFEVAVGRTRRPDEPAMELDGDAVAFDATGADEVVFRFAPNPGEPARPLARIASGGELSRVALAVKQVLAPPTTPRRSSSTRSTRESAGARPIPSGGASGHWPGATRSSSSRTCPRSRPTPMPTTGS